MKYLLIIILFITCSCSDIKTRMSNTKNYVINNIKTKPDVNKFLIYKHYPKENEQFLNPANRENLARYFVN